MMARIEIFPPGLMFPDKLDEVIAWINANVMSPMGRKVLICEWCKAMGVKITEEIVSRVFPRE